MTNNYNYEYNNDYLRSYSTTSYVSQNNYLNNQYIIEVLDASIIKFNENSVKIQRLEELGKCAAKLYLENRLILAGIRFFQTFMPCQNSDKVIKCLTHIGVLKKVKSFNYFNNCLMLLETGSPTLLESGSNVLLEGVCVNPDSFSCAYKVNNTTYYVNSEGNYIPASQYPINTDNYTNYE